LRGQLFFLGADDNLLQISKGFLSAALPGGDEQQISQFASGGMGQRLGVTSCLQQGLLQCLFTRVIDFALRPESSRRAAGCP